MRFDTVPPTLELERELHIFGKWRLWALLPNRIRRLSNKDRLKMAHGTQGPNCGFVAALGESEFWGKVWKFVVFLDTNGVWRATYDERALRAAKAALRSRFPLARFLYGLALGTSKAKKFVDLFPPGD